MTAEQYRQRAAYCYELADQTVLPGFKKVFSNEAQAWLRLAEAKERFEMGSSQRLDHAAKQANG
jgi:hypothetical protein